MSPKTHISRGISKGLVFLGLEVVAVLVELLPAGAHGAVAIFDGGRCQGGHCQQNMEVTSLSGGGGHCQQNLEIEPVFCLFVAGRRVPASTGPVLALETTVVLGLNIDKCLEV